MKRTLTITALLALIIWFAPAHSEASYSELEAYTISYLEGNASIYDPDEGDWIPAERNMPLREGDLVRVGEDSRLEIRARGGTYIRLAQNSILKVQPYDFSTYGFNLERGRAYVNAGETNSVLIDTPVGSAKNWSESVFMVDVGRHGSMQTSVLRGYAYVYTERDEERIDAGNTFFVDTDLYTELRPLGEETPWEDWNKSRDARIFARHQSSRYLPSELSEYSYDLDDYGRWQYYGDYGYVWIPRVAFSGGWAPYREGRWVWMGSDYVWVSYEPWGWAPYHYGRWVYLPRGGWCWVPPRHREVYWSPGYVAWVYTSNSVAWVPLAPGETYYGHGNYGPGSVNIDININKTVYRTDYRNIHVNNAVTTVNRNVFVRSTAVRGDRVKYNASPRENPFVGGKAIFSRPVIDNAKQKVSRREDRDIRYPVEKRKEVKIDREKDLKNERGPVKLPFERNNRPNERKIETPARGNERERVDPPLRRAPGRDYEPRVREEKGQDRGRGKEESRTPERFVPGQKNPEDKVESPRPQDRKVESSRVPARRPEQESPAVRGRTVPVPGQRQAPPAVTKENAGKNKPEKVERGVVREKPAENRGNPDRPDKDDNSPAPDRENGRGPMRRN